MLEGEQRRHFTRTIYSGIYGAHCCEALFHCGLYSPFSFKELRRDCLRRHGDRIPIHYNNASWACRCVFIFMLRLSGLAFSDGFLWDGSSLWSLVFSVSCLGLEGSLSFFSVYDWSACISLGWQALILFQELRAWRAFGCRSGGCSDWVGFSMLMKGDRAYKHNFKIWSGPAGQLGTWLEPEPGLWKNK